MGYEESILPIYRPRRAFIPNWLWAWLNWNAQMRVSRNKNQARKGNAELSELKNIDTFVISWPGFDV